MATKKKRAKDPTAQKIEAILNSEVGKTLAGTLNDLVRQALHLPLAEQEPAPAHLKKQAQAAAEKIRKDREASSPYAILGVDPGMDIADIKLVYRTLIRKYHPDSGKSPDPKKAAQINAAYDEIWKLRGEHK